MANISLREYIRKIENLIDNGQIDQAIGHCKHILKVYPKHIDSYRLLGKALLEKQKYGDASDILQRVLSSVPDDFISHIGMSIIREDENNLDAAIWHMERAFEVQPSNKAVQDELRRLYTSRDGVAPPKIRLTRGALVRMYTRGELYNQAVAEIWSALTEDPNRVDLEVILARIYYLLGQKVEATETCSKLISKLPYCYEANKILTEILPGTTREEDEKVFRQRVVDMDPYFQFVNEKTLATADVPDSKIMVEYYDWDPSINIDEQPDWAQSIGFALDNESSSGDDFSGWLNNIVSQPDETMDLEIDIETESVTPEETQEEAVNRDELQDEKSKIALPTDDEEEKVIPDWIKDAGWEVSNEENETLEKGFTIPSILPLEEEISDNEFDNSVKGLNQGEKEEEEEIQPAEIPAWLQEIAPSENSFNIPDEVDDFEVKNLEDLFDDLEKDKSEFIRSESEIRWENEFAEEKESSLDDTLQGFDFSSLSLNEDESKTKLESVGELDSQEKLEDDLDWIKDLSSDDEPAENEEIPTSNVIENIPELEKEEELDKKSLDQIINELEEIEIEPVPSKDDEWLNSLVIDEIKEDAAKENLIENLKEEIPDWIKSVIDEENEQSPFSSMNDEDSLPDWLSISDEKLESELDDIKISFDDLKDQSIPVDTSIEFEESSENYEEKYSEDSLSELMDDELFSAPEKLKTEEIDIETEGSPLELEISEEVIEEIQPIIAYEEEPVSEIEDQVKEDLVPDLEFYQEADKTKELEEEEQPSVENDEDELESALAWMEGLALKQGAEEETLLSKPEERSETPPDWISEASEPAPDNQDELDTTPSWLKELEIETGEIQSHETIQTLEGITSKEFLETVEDQENEILSEMDKYKDKVHDFEHLFEELEPEGDEKPTAPFEQNVDFDVDETTVVLPEKTESEPLLDKEISDIETEENFEELTPQIEIDAGESSIEIAEPKIQDVESEELFPEFSIEDDILLEEGEELSVEYPEEEVVSEEISEIEDQKFEVTEDISSPEDQIIEPVETIQESMIDEQEIVTKFEEEIEDTQPVKVKDNRFDELETANKFLYNGNLEEALNIFDPLIHDGFELEKIIENIQNALDHHYPIDINLWQALGDAYLKNNQLQNALDAYSKAEDLLL